MSTMIKNVDLSTEICGLRFRNPFLLASGPPTGSKRNIMEAFRSGWAGAVIKTFTLDPKGCTNVTPFIAALRENERTIGISNIEAGSSQPISQWMGDIKEIKSEYRDRVLIGSLMHTEESREENWVVAAAK
jgi:dihydroorotate dehydrogenase